MAGACEQPAVPVPLIEGCLVCLAFPMDPFLKIQVIMLQQTALLDISINVSHHIVFPGIIPY